MLIIGTQVGLVNALAPGEANSGFGSGLGNWFRDDTASMRWDVEQYMYMFIAAERWPCRGLQADFASLAIILW